MRLPENSSRPANVRALGPCAAAGRKSHLREPSEAGLSSPKKAAAVETAAAFGILYEIA